jgi:anti-sigma factor RsiW
LRVRRLTQLAGRRFIPRAEFRRRILGNIRAAESHRESRYARVARWGPALAAAALLLVIVPIWFNRASRDLDRERVFGEVTDLHVTDLASSTPVDVTSNDRHTVKPWFAGKLPFTFNLPELKDSGFTLVGGRVTYLQQTAGAHLLFEIRKHKLSVFVFQDRPELRPLDETFSHQLSFNLETWSEGGLRYFVISDASADDVRKLATLMKASSRT